MTLLFLADRRKLRAHGGEEEIYMPRVSDPPGAFEHAAFNVPRLSDISSDPDAPSVRWSMCHRTRGGLSNGYTRIVGWMRPRRTPKKNATRPISICLGAYCLGLFGLSPIGSGHALASEAWPQRAVNLIVPFGSGSGPDIAARIYAEQLAIRWKQPVVVENRIGAEGLIGVATFTATRDDHTLLFSPAAPITVFPFTQEKITYEPSRDLVPISSAANTFGVIAATAYADVHSVTELIRFARAHPGDLNWASGGGAFPLLFAAFAKNANLELTRVSYRQPNLASQDLAEGRIQILASTLTPLLPIAQAGKIHLLAVTNKTRAPIAPDVPTAIEAGYPELEFDGLTGFFGWRSMSGALQNQIASDIRAVAAIPAVAERLAKAGQIVHAGTPEEFARSIDEQRTKMAAIVRILGKIEP